LGPFSDSVFVFPRTKTVYLKRNGKTNTPNNTRYRIISPKARLPISTC